MSTRIRAFGMAFAVFAMFLVASPSASYAQESERGRAEIGEAQQTLNDEGVRAMIEGDFSGAVALLERSIRMGENNVTYLNLGRAYQNVGNCEKAREALEKAKKAPAVSDPPPSEVDQRADEFLAELDEQCGDEEPPEAADAAPIDEPAPPAEPTPQAVADTDTGSSQTWGWVGVGTGAALIGTGVALHFVAQGKRNQVSENDQGQVELSQREALALYDEANSLDTAALGMVIGGGVLGAVGTYLLVKGSGAESSGASVSISPGPSGVAVTLGGRF